MSILRDSVKTIALSNDTFISGTAIIDSELFMNGYYYYTVKTKQNGSTILMVRVDQPNFRLNSPVNSTEVSIKKINDVYTIITQSNIDSADIYAGSNYYGRGGNGQLSEEYWDRQKQEVDSQVNVAMKALDEAASSLGTKIDLVIDPAGPLRTQITADIETAKSIAATNLAAETARINNLVGDIKDIKDPAGPVMTDINNKITAAKNTVLFDLSTERTRIDKAVADIQTITDPAGPLNQDINARIAANKAAIESSTGILGTQIATLNTNLNEAADRILPLETWRTNVVNDPASDLRQAITTQINNIKAAIEQDGSVLDSRFDNIIATTNQNVSNIKTVDIPAITAPNTGLIDSRLATQKTTIESSTGVLATLMNNKDAAIKTTIEDANSVLSTRMDTKDAGLKSTIESTSGVLASMMDSKDVSLRTNIINTDIKPTKDKTDQLYIDVNTATTGLKDKISKANTDILDLQTNKAAVTRVNAIESSLGGTTGSIGSGGVIGKISTVEGTLSSNGISGTSNIAGRVTNIESNLNPSVGGSLAARLNTVESSKVDSATFSAEVNRVSSLETQARSVATNTSKEFRFTNMSDTLYGWVFSSFTGTLSNTPDISIPYYSLNIVNTSEGNVLQTSGITPIARRETFLLANKTYRIRARYRVTSIAGTQAAIYIGLMTLNKDLNCTTSNNWSPYYPYFTNHTASTDWIDVDITVKGNDVISTYQGNVNKNSELVFFRPFLLLSHDYGTSSSTTGTMQLAYFSIEDTTSVSESNARISSLESTISTPTTGLASKISTLETTINTPTTGLSARMSTVETSKANTTDLNASNLRISTLESDINTGAGSVKTRLGTLETTVSTPTTGLVDKVSNIETTINAPNTGINAKITSLQSTKADSTQMIAATSRLDTLEASVNTGTNNLSSLRGSINDLYSVKANDTVVTGINNRLQSVEASVNTGPDNLANLRANINSLSLNKVDTNTFNAVSQKVDTIDASINSGVNNLNSLRSAINATNLAYVDADKVVTNSVNSLSARMVSMSAGLGRFDFTTLTQWSYSTTTLDINTRDTTTDIATSNSSFGMIGTTKYAGVLLAAKTLIPLEAGRTINSKFKFKRDTYTAGVENNCYLGYYMLDKNGNSCTSWPVYYTYAGTNQDAVTDWVTVDVDIKLADLIYAYPKAKYAVPFFLLAQTNGNPNPSSRMSLQYLELSDVSSMSRNTWAFYKYDGDVYYGLNNLESLEPSQFYTITDQTSLVNNIGDNYVGRLTTKVFVDTGKTVSFTATHDDGGLIYVNGTPVYENASYTSNANVSFYLNPGWSTIDLIWKEGGGADGWTNISNPISNQVKYMSLLANVYDAKIDETSRVALDAQGNAYAIKGIQTNVNGKITGWSSINNGSNSEFIINADSFKIYNSAGGDQAVFGVATVNGQTKMAIRGDMVADGSISAQKLSVGNGLNLLSNSSFRAPFNADPNVFNSYTADDPLNNALADWRMYTHSGHSVSLRSDWSPLGFSSIAIADNAAPINNNDTASLWSKPIPVTPGKYYGFSALLQEHRCSGSDLILYFTNATDKPSAWLYYNNSLITNSASTKIKTVTKQAGVGSAITYDYHFVTAQAPSNAAFMRVLILKGNRPSTETNSYLFANQLMLEESNYPITTPSPWSEGNYTVIDGGSILTGTISANRIATNSLDANKLIAGTITTGLMSANSIAGDRIQANTLDATKIVASSITADKIGSNQIVTSHMQANSIDANRLVAGSITANLIAAGQINTAHMNAGSINADRLISRTISADKLVSKSITGNEIQASAITADLIAAKAITTDKLAIGSGRNLIGNSEFPARSVEKWNGYVVLNNGSTSSLTQFNGINNGDGFDKWTKSGKGMYLLCDAVNTSYSRLEVYSDKIPVVADTYYMASSYISNHRCTGEVIIIYYGSNDSEVYAVASEQIPYNLPNTGVYIARKFIKAKAPSNAVYVRIMFRGYTNGTSDSNAYLFLSDMMLEQATIDQIEPSMYSPSSSTLIDAGNISTGSIRANVIDGEMIRAKIINASKINAVDIIASGSIQASSLATNSITTDKIAANQISADKIQSNAIQTQHIATDTITASMIKAGAISADKLAVTSGENLIYNSTFADIGVSPINGQFDGYDWTLYPYNNTAFTQDKWVAISGRNGTGEIREVNDQYGKSGNTQQTGDNAGLFSRPIAVKAGSWYNLSVLVQAEVCTPFVSIIFYTKDRNINTMYESNTIISVTGLPTYDYQTVPINGGGTTTNYQYSLERRFISMQAPSNAAFVQIFLSKSPRSDLSYTYSIARFTNVMLSESKVKLTVPPEWSQAGSTLIDGGMIKTGYIEANRLRAVDVQAKMIAAGTVSANSIITSGTITSNHIDTNSIRTAVLVTDVITSDMIRANAVSTSELAANSITGDKIIAGQINAGHIVSKTITADQIASQAITATEINAASVKSVILTADSVKAGMVDADVIDTRNIKAGAITTDKLSIGSGINMFNVTEFTNNYVGRWTGTNSAVTAISNGDNWSVYTKGGNGVVLSVAGNNSPISLQSPDIKVTPNLRYIFSAYISAHRTNPSPVIHWLDSNKNFISQISNPVYSYDNEWNINTGSDDRRFVVGTAPSNAVYARCFMYSADNPSGNTNYIMLSQPQLEQVSNTNTMPSIYKAGGSTLIDGGRILTNSINANAITAGTITANQISANAGIAATQLAITDPNTNKIYGTYINKNGIFSTGNIVSGNGFYLLKQGTTDTTTAISGVQDSRLVFGIDSSGKALFNGDIYSNNAYLNNVAQAEVFRVKLFRNTALSTSDVNDPVTSLINSNTVNCTLSQSSGAPITTGHEGNSNVMYINAGETFCSANIPIARTDYLTTQVSGNLTFTFMSSTGSGVGTHRFQVQYQVGSSWYECGFGTYSAGSQILMRVSVPVSFTVAPSSTGSGLKYNLPVRLIYQGTSFNVNQTGIVFSNSINIPSNAVLSYSSILTPQTSAALQSLSIFKQSIS